MNKLELMLNAMLQQKALSKEELDELYDILEKERKGETSDE